MKGFQMKISMRSSKPLMWRRITIPMDATFYQLHQVLQIAFGWMNYHLHDFTIPSLGIRICDIEDEDIQSDMDEDVYLFEILSRGYRFVYTYDFGDGWTHDILVEDEIELEESYPKVIKWKGDNYGEDTGNVDGYARYVARSQDENDPERNDIAQWLRRQHQPFLLMDVNEKLSELIVEPCPVEMSVQVETELNKAILAVRKQLWKKEIEDLSLVILEEQGEKVYIGFNQVQGDITLQIYETETEYLQGVDYVSSHSQGNLFAHAICIILSKETIPIQCWKTSDHMGMAKRMKPGTFPTDLDEPDAIQTTRILTRFSMAIKHWKEKRFPSYENNECLHASFEDTWQLRVEQIRLHRDQEIIHISESQRQELLELEKSSSILHIDLLSIPGDQMEQGKMDVILVIETNEEDVEYYENSLSQRDLANFQSINIAVVEVIQQFILDDGMPDKIIVNNENMRFLLCGICEDIHVPIQVTPFVTQLEKEFMEIFDDTDMQVLDTLADMTPDEFFDFMSKMNEDEMEDFHEFLKQYMDIEEYQDLFDQEARLTNKDEKSFDA